MSPETPKPARSFYVPSVELLKVGSILFAVVSAFYNLKGDVRALTYEVADIKAVSTDRANRLAGIEVKASVTRDEVHEIGGKVDQIATALYEKRLIRTMPAQYRRSPWPANPVLATNPVPEDPEQTHDRSTLAKIARAPVTIPVAGIKRFVRMVKDEAAE